MMPAPEQRGPAAMTPEAVRAAFAAFPSGVVAIAAEVDETHQVMVASSFTVGVSLDPPLVTAAVQRSSSTWRMLRAAPRIGVSVLGETHLGQVRQLASSDRARRLEGVGVTTTPGRAVLLDRAPLWMECSVHGEHRAGDHDIVVFRVEELELDLSRYPLLWHRSTVEALSSR